jgi:hypothetical protein
VSLLQLPERCLVTVLRCCAGDPRSVCSAARAHSRLHQAAVEALKSITAEVNQKQLDNLMGVYLNSHGQHSDSIILSWQCAFRSLLVRHRCTHCSTHVMHGVVLSQISDAHVLSAEVLPFSQPNAFQS